MKCAGFVDVQAKLEKIEIGPWGESIALMIPF
jgi:hypothetical protein